MHEERRQKMTWNYKPTEQKVGEEIMNLLARGF
jgi:hypothetical protein